MRILVRTATLLALALFANGAWAADPAAEKAGEDSAWLSSGVERLMSELRARELELQRRDRELESRERSLVDLETVIDERVAELDRVRAEVERQIEEWTNLGTDRAAQLAKVYASMPADRAGALLAKLDLDLSVVVLQRMKDKKSAAVLAAMNSPRALEISERLLRPLAPPPAKAGAKK